MLRLLENRSWKCTMIKMGRATFIKEMVSHRNGTAKKCNSDGKQRLCSAILEIFLNDLLHTFQICKNKVNILLRNIEAITSNNRKTGVNVVALVNRF